MIRDHWREFPQELHSFSQVPPKIAPSLQPYLRCEDQFIRLYLVPQPRSFWEWFRDEPPRNSIFCLTSEEVLIAREERDRSISVEHFPIGDIVMVEVGTVLLNSWLNLFVVGRQGLDEITFRYGTIFARQFRDAVLWLLALTNGSSSEPHHSWRMPGEDHLASLPLKFNNAARGYWVDGETALGSLFIDILAKPRWIYNSFLRVYSNATAIVVSSQQICVISEQDSSSSSGRWGQVWRFCPLKRIARAEISETRQFPEIHFELSCTKSRSGDPVHVDLNIPFHPSQRSGVASFLKIIRPQIHHDVRQAN